MAQSEKELTRRSFLQKTGTGLATIPLVKTFALAQKAESTIPVQRVPLSYGQNELEPIISAETIRNHYDQHHFYYEKTLRTYIRRHREYQDKSLEEIMQQSAGKLSYHENITVLANLLWNHNLYWKSLRPPSQDPAVEKRHPFGKAIKKKFGSIQECCKLMVNKANTIGIGWVWLIQKGDTLDVIWTDYQKSLFGQPVIPLLCIDVWEHAYYLDYQHNRRAYMKALTENLLNWQFAADHFVEQ